MAIVHYLKLMKFHKAFRERVSFSSFQEISSLRPILKFFNYIFALKLLPSKTTEKSQVRVSQHIFYCKACNDPTHTVNVTLSVCPQLLPACRAVRYVNRATVPLTCCML